MIRPTLAKSQSTVAMARGNDEDRIEPAENPFLLKVLPMSPVRALETVARPEG